MRNLYSTHPDEQYANAFAMALLMPREHVACMHRLGYSTERMASEFDVPVEVMALRRAQVVADGL